METATSHPGLAEQLRSIGISESYASQIANEKRAPSMPLAIKIHRQLGLRLGPIKHATEDQIAALEAVVGTGGGE